MDSSKRSSAPSERKALARNSNRQQREGNDRRAHDATLTSHQLMTNDFAGRVVIVTGAWRGLGRAAAERFHERGAAVAVNVRDRTRAEDLAASIGERALGLPGDVAAPGVAEEMVRNTLDRFGRVDVVINNAALALSTRFPDLSP